MPKGPVCCLTARILILSLQPEGFVTPIHLPGVNVRGSLKVLEVTEMSSPNKTSLCDEPSPSQVPAVMARVRLGCPNSLLAGEL